MSKHQKRNFAPKTWKIKRKGIKYITKPSPGSHKASISLPLNVVLRDMLKFADTNREVKFMVQNRNISVDGVKKKNIRFPIGLFDTLSLNDTEHFRVVLNNRGKMDIAKIGKEESILKSCKIIGKKAVNGKIQLNFSDGKNIFVEKDSYRVGDGVLLTLGKKSVTVKDHIKLEKGALIFLTGGRHIGQTGKVQDILHNRIIYKTEDGNVVETLKDYAFPIGKEKAAITLK
jgi:small subunit ribosomal protein S4e